MTKVKTQYFGTIAFIKDKIKDKANRYKHMKELNLLSALFDETRQTTTVAGRIENMS